jgi:hypothetical protein
MTTVVVAQTIPIQKRWWNIANWSLGVVPTSSHDVVIQAGKAVTVYCRCFYRNIVIMSTGILTVYYYFNRFEDVTINSGGV